MFRRGHKRKESSMAKPEPKSEPQSEGLDRTSRYSGVFPVDKLAKTHALVIGVGAVGRRVALDLAIMGVGELTIVDFDTISTENLGPQGWHFVDVGVPKVEALAGYIRNHNPGVKVNAINGRIRKTDVSANIPYDILFLHVDSMKARKDVFDAWASRDAKRPFAPLIDSRMGAESLSIHTIHDDKTCGVYRKEFYSDAETQDDPCTMRATAYCAGITAGMCISNYTRMLRDDRPPATLRLSLLADDLISEHPWMPPEPDKPEPDKPDAAKPEPKPAPTVKKKRKTTRFEAQPEPEPIEVDTQVAAT